MTGPGVPDVGLNLVKLARLTGVCSQPGARVIRPGLLKREVIQKEGLQLMNRGLNLGEVQGVAKVERLKLLGGKVSILQDSNPRNRV
jgi:hypothetical protein